MNNIDTICAIATAMGGAIAVIRVSGPDAIGIVQMIFGRDITRFTPRTAILGDIIKRNSDGDEIVDNVVITTYRNPHSYTGEDCVEIACHGSQFIATQIINLLIDCGCRMAEPGEYTQRAFLNGKMDLSQAEAVADLIASDSAASHRIALNQMRGTFSTKLSELSDQLLTMSSLLELELDFSEEVVEFADRTQLISLATRISNELQALIKSYFYGNVIKNGVPVAIIGAPNVGKSTLLNQLLHEERAIVSDIQGTTRDVIEDSININGLTFRFLDTAGIRATEDTIEQMGIERSLKAVERAYVIIMLNEPGVDFPEINVREDQHIIKITNKTDEFQAINGIGIDKLVNKLLNTIPSTSDTDIIITNSRHLEALKLARTSISHAIEALNSQIPSDLIAEDLRETIRHLSSIIGRSLLEPETTLHSIFSHFCIGK